MLIWGGGALCSTVKIVSETVFSSNPKLSNSMDYSVSREENDLRIARVFWEKKVKMSF